MIQASLEGKSQVEMAQTFGISPLAVCGIVNSPLFQDEVARRRKEKQKVDNEQNGLAVLRSREKLDQASELAADTLAELTRSAKSETVKMQSAKSILDLVYGKDEKRQQNSGQTIVMNIENLQFLQQVLDEDRELSQENQVQKRESERIGSEEPTLVSSETL